MSNPFQITLIQLVKQKKQKPFNKILKPVKLLNEWEAGTIVNNQDYPRQTEMGRNPAHIPADEMRGKESNFCLLFVLVLSK